MDPNLGDAFKDLLEPGTVELLKEAQFTTFIALKEAEATLQSFNARSAITYAEVRCQIEKKAVMLQGMAADLKHIYRQLNNIENKLSQLECCKGPQNKESSA